MTLLSLLARCLRRPRPPATVVVLTGPCPVCPAARAQSTCLWCHGKGRITPWWKHHLEGVVLYKVDVPPRPRPRGGAA
jgi:hypothetical protein